MSIQVHSKLYIVHIEGFHPKEGNEFGQGSDSWLSAHCPPAAMTLGREQWDTMTWFLLLADDDAGIVATEAPKFGYKILSIQEVTRPQRLGKMDEAVEIMKHRLGWVVYDEYGEEA